MKQYQQLNEEIISHLLAVVPEEWFSIQLTVKRVGDKQPMYISSPEQYRDIVAVPDEVFMPVHQLGELLDENEPSRWSKMEFVATYSEEIESWKYYVDYSYIGRN